MNVVKYMKQHDKKKKTKPKTKPQTRNKKQLVVPRAWLRQAFGLIY